MQKVSEYQLCDHGIDGAQYFSGCGISYTSFDYVSTGCGSNFAEAIDEALDGVAQDGFDSEALEEAIMLDEGLSKWPTVPNTDKYYTEENGENEMYYYVSIRWK